MKKTESDILDLKNKIALKKEKIKNADKFTPCTNCVIDFAGKVWNLNVLKIDELYNIYALVKVMYDIGTDFKINGFELSKWLHDIQNKIDITTIKEEKERLDNLEKKLNELLSTETKVELELENIKKQL